jgi:hypothetical protein
MGQASGPMTHDVVINEIHYNPDVKTEPEEFVELYNAGSSDISLAGWRLCGAVEYAFPATAVLTAGGYAVVCQDWLTAITKWPQLLITVNDHDVAFGPFEGRLGNAGQTVTVVDPSLRAVDQVSYKMGFPWPTVGDPTNAARPAGSGASIQLIRPDMDNGLPGSWRSALPTPGAANKAVYADPLPPDVEDVAHSPYQPASGQAVTITAKVANPDGVGKVVCSIQVVEPGKYVALHDAAYQSNWTTLSMHDDGLEGDAKAGDGIYSVQVPASTQVHRRLVRYRITAFDTLGLSVTVPYEDDPQPNFAYFVYDGVPAWKGAANPNGGSPLNEVVEYSQQVMSTLPVYHLISKKTDVEASTWIERYTGSDYKWWGTLVYDGKVYDHIRYRSRGGVWRYSMGKNMWKFDFNRGHDFQAKDDYGQPYKTCWRKLNFSACIQQGDYWHRGEQGMFEAAGFRLFNLMGTPASKTHWLEFRVIDEADETGATQYVGDLWGLYMAIEQMDGRFLDEHDMPDGNLFKMDQGSGDAGPGGGTLNNQGRTQPTDNSDLVTFRNAYGARPQEAWWRQNVNLASYYGFRCTVEGIHHGDMEGNKNWFFYHDPVTNQWTILPWDLDLTWANNMYGSGADEFTRNGVFSSSNANLQIEYNNRQREFHDLIYNADQGYQMLDELAAVIHDPNGGPSMVDVDRAMWDYNPVMISRTNSDKGGQGRFYAGNPSAGITIPSPGGFPGMVQLMKDYIVAKNRAFDTYKDDPAAPAEPQIKYVGQPGFAANDLVFETSAFQDAQGPATFAALQWRIAEVEPGSHPVVVKPSEQVLVESGQTWRYFKGKSEPSSQVGAWRQLGFDDSAWLEGATMIGFGSGGSYRTTLTDMQKNYSTVYLRKTFTVDDLSAVGSLDMEVKYNDGFVAWINGTLVASGNVSATDLAYSATTGRAKSVSSFATIALPPDPNAYLKAGQNVLAVHLLNMTLTNTNCYLDARLVAKPPVTEEPNDATTTRIVQGRRGKYEIEANWQSGEITPYNSRVTIPAGAVEAGKTYRVRCRMKDNTNRWSNWSEPVQFAAGAPLAGKARLPLVITELMYNPPASASEDGWDRDEFEFVELMNAGTAAIDLAGVSLSEGVTFSFAGSAVQQLGPGQFVLVVRNRVAFECRYGTALALLIAGEYGGKLSNSGERLKLTDLGTGVLADFEYKDSWYGSTDGQGRSLVLASPTGTTADQLGQKASWRASSQWGGSPGAADVP